MGSGTDNTTLNKATIPDGDIIATDNIDGVKHQRVKMQIGDDGSATDVSAANPIPTELSENTITIQLLEALSKMVEQQRQILIELRISNKYNELGHDETIDEESTHEDRRR